MRAEQLLRAARTVTRRTDPRRVKYLRARLSRTRQTVLVAAVAYHLATGTVPRTLWDNE